MRYRKLDANGDYVVGQGVSEFLYNTPATVAQAVQTRLLLETGEWFLDVTEGTPYSTEILGEGTQPTYDDAIRTRILETENVTEITSYSSTLDPVTRALTVNATISTAYGATTISQVIG